MYTSAVDMIAAQIGTMCPSCAQAANLYAHPRIIYLTFFLLTHWPQSIDASTEEARRSIHLEGSWTSVRKGEIMWSVPCRIWEAMMLTRVVSQLRPRKNTVELDDVSMNSMQSMQTSTRATAAVSRALQEFAKTLQDPKLAAAGCVNLEAYIVGTGVPLGILSEAGLLTLLAKLAKSPVGPTFPCSLRLSREASCKPYMLTCCAARRQAFRSFRYLIHRCMWSQVTKALDRVLWGPVVTLQTMMMRMAMTWGVAGMNRLGKQRRRWKSDLVLMTQVLEQCQLHVIETIDGRDEHRSQYPPRIHFWSDLPRWLVMHSGHHLRY